MTSQVGRVPLRHHFKRDGAAKKGYDTIEAAQAAAAVAQAAYGSKRRPFRAYECPDCGRFHFGHRPAPGRKTRKAAA